MGFFDFGKKKEEKKDLALKDPFTLPSGEPIIEEAGQEFPIPQTQSHVPPPKPVDPYDLVESPPFKPKIDDTRVLDEVYDSLQSISTQLKAVADKLREATDRLRR